MTDELVQWPLKLDLETKVGETFDNLLYGTVSWEQVEELRDFLTTKLEEHQSTKN